jgi:hypothetical protein
MAVVTVLSQYLTNQAASPRVLTGAYIAGQKSVDAVSNVVVGASDSAGSLYKYFRIPSNARVVNVSCMNDANTSGTSYKCGVYFSSDSSSSGVVVANSDQIFFSAVSMASARNVWTTLYSPQILSASFSIVNVEKRIWELLGLAADPVATYEVVITAVTPGSAGGNMALQISYVE